MILDRSDLEFILVAMSHDRLTTRQTTRRAALRLRLADYLARPAYAARASESCVGVPKE